MRRAAFLGLVLLVVTAWAVAQSSSSSSDTQAGSTTSGQTGNTTGSTIGSGNEKTNSQPGMGTAAQGMGQSSTSETASGESSFTGCLQGTSGNYTLLEHSGKSYQLRGEDKSLSKHVGQEISVRGTTEGAGGATEASAGGTDIITVTNVTKIADTCPMSQK